LVLDDPSAGDLMKSWTDTQRGDFGGLVEYDVCLSGQK
jgi:hypothetical protein